MPLTITMVAALVSLSASTPKTLYISAHQTSPVVTTVTSATPLTGRVLSAAGDPIADAKVSVYATGSITPLTTARTDSNGNFTMATPPASGSYTLHVLQIGYSPVVVALTRQHDSWTVPGDISMQPIQTDGLTSPNGSAQQ